MKRIRKKSATWYRKKCVVCGVKVAERNSKYCDKLFITGTRRYNKNTCAYRGRANLHLTYNKKRGAYSREWKVKHPLKPEQVYRTYKYNANLVGREFTLTPEQFIEFLGVSCYYCGENLDAIRLDRVDNSKGYTRENVVSCCPKCNFAKGHKLSPEQFIELAKKVSKNHGS